MKLYYGSTVEGLKELCPHIPIGAHSPKPLVYLSPTRQLALHFIWDTQRLGVKMPMLDIRKDGTVVFQEMFSSALEYLYKGVSGYIYTCEADYQPGEDFLSQCSIAVDTEITVTDCEYIDDVYKHILRYADQGKLIYEHYEDLPQWRLDLIRGQVLRRIKRYDLINDAAHPSRNFIRDNFPQYWAEAKVLSKYSLL